MRTLLAVVFTLMLSLATSLSHATKVGDVAPPVNLRLLGSDQVLSLSSLRGKVVLVDFWSSWCASCRQSIPYFDELRNKLSNEDFEVYAVNLDDKVSEAKAFLSNYPVSYPIVWDEAQDSPEEFDITKMPTSFLLDQQGVVRAVYVEFKKTDIAGFEKDIRRLLKP
jgi:thiol-disulfide isomerase/thioredoxin